MRIWRNYRLEFELVIFKLSDAVQDLPVSLYAVIPYVSRSFGQIFPEFTESNWGYSLFTANSG